MKKYFAIVLCVATLLVLGAISVSAYDQAAGYWIVSADKTEEILAGEAGERTTAWEVPFLHIKPSVDGTISRNEYVPFELYEDYLSWMAPIGDATHGTTEEEFTEFYDSTQQDFFDAYWGWDGTYMYVAFNIRCLNGFNCTPDKMGGDMFLFAYNCLQVGIANVDAQGKDASYVELGFGVHSETKDPITFNWSGNYRPIAGEDFVGSYDEENQVLTYECRIHLQQALGLADRTVQNGDEMNYSWLLAVNGEATHTNETWQLAFCHGIGGPYSSKETQYFARVKFVGMPDGTEVEKETIADRNEDDVRYGLTEFVDLSKEEVVKTYDAEYGAVDFITENGESFARFTCLSNDDIAYMYSSKYPQNVQAAWGLYVVVKYRTSSEQADEMGIIFRNQDHTEYDVDNCPTDYIGNDGEWHTMIFDLSGNPAYVHFILNVGLVPFPFADKPAGQTVDIAWIKFYQHDPFDLYADSLYDPNAGEEATEADETTDDPVGTEADTAVDTGLSDTSATTENTTDTTATGGTDQPADSGCASTISLGAMSVLLAMGVACLFRKKRED